VCAVGDNFQAIYSWAGADSESINNIQKRLNAKVLPLPISYRCAKNIVKLAQELVPDIQHAPLAKDGAVSYIKEKELLTSVAPGDFILSRINAPLIKYCLKLLKLGIPANIQGRDVGANLSFLIKKSKKKTVKSFLDWLSKWGQE
jgi:superfamily I DNA/RNA helicase